MYEDKPVGRLDASESVFLQRELESIDTEVYEVVYADLLARSFLPTQPGIPDWARVYTFRDLDKFGEAKFIGNGADDLPRVDVVKAESSKLIKPCGASYGYNLFEIRAAAGQIASLI